MPKYKELCSSCGEKVTAFDGTYLSTEQESKLYCTCCFNKITSDKFNLDFEHPIFQTIELRDSENVSHHFHFRSLLSPPYLSIEAAEICPEYPEGYHFQILGDPEEDPLDLWRKLYDRMRRAMKQKYLKQGEYGLRIGDDMIVRGKIEWDDETDGKLPLLVIDGKGITWEEFGRMMMTYEGWQVKMEIYDRSEERQLDVIAVMSDVFGK